MVCIHDKSPPLNEQAQEINIKDYFSSFLNHPFKSKVRHWNMTSRFHLNLNRWSISSRDLSTLGEKKMIRGKNGCGF